MSKLKTQKTADEKRLAYNAYMRKYNSRRRAEKKLAWQKVVDEKYNNEILGGKEHE